MSHPAACVWVRQWVFQMANPSRHNLIFFVFSCSKNKAPLNNQLVCPFILKSRWIRGPRFWQTALASVRIWACLCARLVGKGRRWDLRSVVWGAAGETGALVRGHLCWQRRARQAVPLSVSCPCRKAPGPPGPPGPVGVPRSSC